MLSKIELVSTSTEIEKAIKNIMTNELFLENIFFIASLRIILNIYFPEFQASEIILLASGSAFTF